MEMRRERSTQVFSLNLGLGDPQPAVSRCSEQQGNTCTISTALQVKVPLCLSEGLELGNRPCPTQGLAALGTLFPARGQSIPRGSRWDPLPQAKFPCETCCTEIPESWSQGSFLGEVKKAERGVDEEDVLACKRASRKSRMPPAQGTSRSASISAARGFPRTSRMCHALHVSPVP